MTDPTEKTDVDAEQIESTSTTQMMAIASTYKVLGELDDGSGVGVLGKNLASNGTPIGVQGAVPNASGGFGLATPDDARVGGDLATTSGFTVTIDGARGLSIGTESSGDAGNLVGGHSSNGVDPGYVGGTVGGGGFDDGNADESHRISGEYGTIGGGKDNTVGGNQGTVGGGLSNTASGTDSTVSGGDTNTASGYRATVSGGNTNTASEWFTTVGGGRTNTASGDTTTVGGGEGNTASKIYATVGGGNSNEARAKRSTLGGGASNTATSGSEYATISGGTSNSVTADKGTVGGGDSNTAAYHATVAGGVDNDASSPSSTVAGGERNAVNAAGSAIGGGVDNTADAFYSTISGGRDNTTAGNSDSTIGGGRYNTVTDLYATVGGGDRNEAHGNRSAIGGGQANRTGMSGTTKGLNATVPGGDSNVAVGDYAFAAGRQAQANHNGTFVWADSTDAAVTSTSGNQFLVQASNGVGINTTSPDAPLDIAGGNYDLSNTEGDLKIGSDSHRLKFGIATTGGGAGDTHIRTESTNLNKLSFGVGSSDVMVVNSGSVHPASDDTYSLGRSNNRWTSVYATNGTIQTSDARLKTNVADLDGGLEQVRAMRPVTYEWDEEEVDTEGDARSDEADETRIGLIAQEVTDVVPEAVIESGDDGPLGLAYDMLIPVLIDAISEQQETIEECRDTIQRRDEQIEALTDRLGAVESQLGIGPSGSATPADD